MVLCFLDEALACCSLLSCWKAGSIFHEGACSSHSSASHASFVHPLVDLSFYMCSLHSSYLLSCHVCWCTYTCSHSWRENIKSKNLLVYHDTWSFRMQVTKRGNKVMKWDDGSNYWWKLRKSHWVIKTGNLSRQWLSARSGSARRQNCTNFGRDNQGYRKARRACSTHFSKRTVSGVWAARFLQFSRGAGRAAWWVTWQGLHSLLMGMCSICC